MPQCWPNEWNGFIMLLLDELRMYFKKCVKNWNLRVNIVVQQVKLLRTTISHIRVPQILVSASYDLPTNVNQRKQHMMAKVLGFLPSHVEEPNGVPGYWLWPNPALGITGIWEVNQRTEEWSLPFK